MPPARFRLRTQMIAVAVVAMVLIIRSEAVRLRRLSDDYRQRARQYAQDETVLRGSVATYLKGAVAHRSEP